MRRIGRLSGLVLFLFVGCGGASPAPPAASPPASSALAKEPVEKADLSPVAPPQELFVVGRLARPGHVADTLGKWGGTRTSFRGFLALEFAGLDRAIAWDAPVELAVALSKGGKRLAVRSVVSLGVTSTGELLNVVRDRGVTPERYLPEVFAFPGPTGGVCAVGPALGSAKARVVCGERAADLDDLFAYATRGLPNENLGSRDLEVELRADPLRQRFASEIAGARLFAGFLVRQIELDSPRFDRVLADAAYGLADELVAEVEDTDSLRLGGKLDDANQNLQLELAWKFRSTRSWLAADVAELARRPAPPPPAFARLPASSTAAGYTVDLGTERMAPVRASIAEIADAYLEHERVGKKARERATRLLTTVFGLTGAYVNGEGKLSGKQSEAAERLGWRLTRVERSIADIDRVLDDLHALVADRELYKTLAKRFDLDPKVQAKSELGPLKGKGIPAGARVLTITIPPGLSEGLQKGADPRFKLEAKEPVKLVVVAAPDGKAATVVVVTSDKKEATERLLAFLGEGGERLGSRKDLASLQATRALHGGFFTLLGLFDLFGAKTDKVAATLPNRGETPIVQTVTATQGPPLVLSGAWSVPSGVFADLPGLVSNVGSALF